MTNLLIGRLWISGLVGICNIPGDAINTDQKRQDPSCLEVTDNTIILMTRRGFRRTLGVGDGTTYTFSVT
jgi:hypothetical protein